MSLSALLKEIIPTGAFWTHSRVVVDGCTPVSPGCANCWLAGMYRRNLPGMKTYTEIMTKAGFNGVVMERPSRLEGIIPKRIRKPRVWTYWSDVFHPGVSDEFRRRLLAHCGRSFKDYHIVITKRPEVAVACLGHGSHYPNVIILVTMEDQERVNLRAPHARKLAAMGWKVGVLAEPLLGPIDLELTCVKCGHYTDAECPGSPSNCRMRPPFSWLITGGESGPKARPAHPNWFRSLRDQAQAAGVPFLFKQWGEWAPGDGAANPIDVDDDPEQTKFLTMEWTGAYWRDIGYPMWCDWQDNYDIEDCVFRVGKKKAGRNLDGRTWDEVPQV